MEKLNKLTRRIKKGERCEYEGCKKLASTVIYNDDKKELNIFCDTHVEVVTMSMGGEYISVCPNCGCMSSVN